VKASNTPGSDHESKDSLGPPRPDVVKSFVLSDIIIAPVSPDESDFLRPVTELKKISRQLGGDEHVQPHHIGGGYLQLSISERAVNEQTEREGARVLAELETLKQKSPEPTDPGGDE